MNLHRIALHPIASHRIALHLEDPRSNERLSGLQLLVLLLPNLPLLYT